MPKKRYSTCGNAYYMHSYNQGASFWTLISQTPKESRHHTKCSSRVTCGAVGALNYCSSSDGHINVPNG